MIKHRDIFKMDSKGKIRVYFIEQEDSQYRMVTGVFDGNLTRSKWTIAKPKNIGRSNETTAEEQASIEISARYTKKSDQSYFDTLEEAKNNPEGKFFEVMLATENDKVKDKKYPYIADPKLDGMRMTETMEEAISRKGKPILTVPHIVGSLKAFHSLNIGMRLDGEVYNHEYKEDFNTLMSIARRMKPTDSDLETSKEKLEYHVYDIFVESNPLMPAIERKKLIDRIVSDYSYVEVVPWELVHNDEELEAVKERHLAEGYEGTILRSPDEPYHNKRTKHLIKVKDFITEEFKILDIVEGKGNKSGKAGTIVIDKLDVNGDPVSCGIRGSWHYCENIYNNRDKLIGSTATIRHFGETPDLSLRFPVCIDINRPD